MGRSYLKGIIGAFIGGLIATIPWILLYIYGNMMCSYMAFLVGIGALKGYQYRGLTDRKLPIIITVVSLICVSIATLVIIPTILMFQLDATIGDFNMASIYSFGTISSMMVKDYIIAIIFTFLGLKGVTSRLNV